VGARLVEAGPLGVRKYSASNGLVEECLNQARAHGGEITDVAIQGMDDTWLIASSGRDRMV
jgi:hypothetical protein